jgi:hypothetical protein
MVGNRSQPVCSSNDIVAMTAESDLMSAPARLRAPNSGVVTALNSRTEVMGARAAGRTFGKSHSTILRWEERLANQDDAWSPPAPADQEVTLEWDEVYTRVGENLPPC